MEEREREGGSLSAIYTRRCYLAFPLPSAVPMLEQCVDLNKWILYIQPLLAFMERVDYNWSYTGKNIAAAQGCPERDLYSRMWYGPAPKGFLPRE